MGASSVDFNEGPKTYTVSVENGEPRDYVVTVRQGDNNIKEITGFYFSDPVAVGVFDEPTHTITVKVPYGTNLSSLAPTVYYNGLSLDPVSGMKNDFSRPSVIYTVTARNKTKQPYTVKVLPAQNSAKEITAFSFPGVGTLETVIGAVPDADGNIPISVTVASNTVLSSLSPSITHTGKTISPGPGIPGDFRQPVFYTVTAEDGTTKDYAVSVHVSNNSSAIITGFVFKSVLVKGVYIQAVGSIDQDKRTITVAFPRIEGFTIPTSLTPTITYVGDFITPEGVSLESPANDSPRRVSPFIDTVRNFTSSFDTYTVTAADGTEREYTVKVKFEEQNLGLNVKFQEITDPDLITATFNQPEGLLTLTIDPTAPSSRNPSGYRSPYEWDLDGKNLNAPATETTLNLRVKSLGAGSHQLVLFAFGKDDGLPYSNVVSFTVDE
jgi:hypothetical protein